MSKLQHTYEIDAVGNLEDILNDRVLNRGCRFHKEYYSKSKELAIKVSEYVQENIDCPDGDYVIILAHQTGGESHHVWKKTENSIQDEEIPYIIEALKKHYHRRNIFPHILTLQKSEESNTEPKPEERELPYTLH